MQLNLSYPISLIPNAVERIQEDDINITIPKCVLKFDEWQGEHMIFNELKRSGKDRMRNTQIKWLKACLEFGLQPAQFIMIEWSIQSYS